MILRRRGAQSDAKPKGFDLEILGAGAAGIAHGINLDQLGAEVVSAGAMGDACASPIIANL